MRMLACIFCLSVSVGAAPSNVEFGPNEAPTGNSRNQSSAYAVGFDADRTVRLVQAAKKEASPVASPRAVIAFSISGQANGESASIPASTEQTVPAGARWPDAHGRISFSLAETAKGQGSVGVRNPWEARGSPESPAEETSIACEGTLVAALGTSVAFLNGRVLGQGDMLGNFRLARILPDEVVLERNGRFVVIPRGSRAIVSIAEH